MHQTLYKTKGTLLRICPFDALKSKMSEVNSLTKVRLDELSRRAEYTTDRSVSMIVNKGTHLSLSLFAVVGNILF